MSREKPRKRPRRLGDTLDALMQSVAPQTPLAGVQGVWAEVVGEAVAGVTEVMSEQEGVVTVRCESSVWANELQMMGPRLLARLSAELGDEAPVSLRFVT